MKKSNWDICFSSYIKECTRYNIYKECFKSTSLWSRVLIFSSFLIFFILLLFAFYEAFSADRTRYYRYFLGFITFEFISIILIIRALNVHRKDEYSDFELSQMPPEDYKEQKARYLKFKRTLILNDIKQCSVTDVLDVLEARILMDKHKGISIEKVIGFSFTFAMSILIATMKNLSLVTIGQIGAVGVLFIVFLHTIISLKPNKTEQLYELKYFLTMYQKTNPN